MDSRMPVMGGLHAIKKLRADGYKLPVIMVSTEGEKGKVLEAIRAGANDYLIKPFNPKDIQSKLEKHLSHHTA
jgi:two-component system chemotaxis response regulator CheY